jgi:hypothetical protein
MRRARRTFRPCKGIHWVFRLCGNRGNSAKLPILTLCFPCLFSGLRMTFRIEPELARRPAPVCSKTTATRTEGKQSPLSLRVSAPDPPRWAAVDPIGSRCDQRKRSPDASPSAPRREAPSPLLTALASMEAFSAEPVEPKLTRLSCNLLSRRVQYAKPDETPGNRTSPAGFPDGGRCRRS